jgi:hypothetical protein
VLREGVRVRERPGDGLRRLAMVTAAAAAAGFAAILIHSWLTTDAGGPFYRPLFYFSSATNLAVCGECLRVARGAGADVRRLGHLLTSAWLMALGAAVYGEAGDPGLFLAHAVVPALVTLLWVAMPGDRRARWADCLRWTTFPLLYTGLVLVHGHATGFYPYQLLDVSLLGWGEVGANIARACAAVLLVGADIVAIEKMRAGALISPSASPASLRPAPSA